MKKIRRTRIRTETSRLVFIQEQTAGSAEAQDAHEICPACGQPIIAPVNALPAVCAELHDENNRDGVFDLKKQETEK